MSKASEWHQRLNDLEKHKKSAPTFRAKDVRYSNEEVKVAVVNTSGQFSMEDMEDGRVLTATAALALADWINDTFGESDG